MKFNNEERETLMALKGPMLARIRNLIYKTLRDVVDEKAFKTLVRDAAKLNASKSSR